MYSMLKSFEGSNQINLTNGNTDLTMAMIMVYEILNDSINEEE